MSWLLNCGSPRLPGGLRENDVPGDEETAEQEECLGEEACTWCGFKECLCRDDDAYPCPRCGDDTCVCHSS